MALLKPEHELTPSKTMPAPPPPSLHWTLNVDLTPGPAKPPPSTHQQWHSALPGHGALPIPPRDLNLSLVPRTHQSTSGEAQIQANPTSATGTPPPISSSTPGESCITFGSGDKRLQKIPKARPPGTRLITARTCILECQTLKLGSVPWCLTASKIFPSPSRPTRRTLLEC